MASDCPWPISSREETAGGEVGVGLGDEAAVDVHAGFAGVEGEWRLVVANLGVEGFGVGGGDVGWVGDDGVEAGFTGQG